MERRDLGVAIKEFTTQKIRQEWAEHEDQLFGTEVAEDWQNSTLNKSGDAADGSAQSICPDAQITKDKSLSAHIPEAAVKEETKSKKKRRKKSMMKKKATQRKSSSSSSVGSLPSDQNDAETDTVSLSNNTATTSSNDDSPKSEVSSLDKEMVSQQIKDIEQPLNNARNINWDIHFFSDTELASGKSPTGSRPSTPPIQSDSEFEMSLRDQKKKTDHMSTSASWKWGELPTQDEEPKDVSPEEAKNAQRNSMLSNMFSFMKQTKKLRKGSSEGVYLSDLDTEGLDPEVAALYFPPINKSDPSMNMLAGQDDDRESGNGTSLPHSPSSMEGPKSLDSDYEEGKSNENKYV